MTVVANWVRLPIPIPPYRMTYPEFLDWADEDVHAEWVDGKVEFTHLAIDPETLEITMSVSKSHTLIGRFLITLLQLWSEAFQAGEVFYAPYQMKTGADLPGREPDVMYVSSGNMHIVKEKHLEGPADVAIEIVSEESVTRDRIWKLAEYERGGVREYWLIDPLQGEALFYELDANGKYRQIETASDGVFRSNVMPGVWFRTEWFWQDKLPPASTVLKAWNIEP